MNFPIFTQKSDGKSVAFNPLNIDAVMAVRSSGTDFSAITVRGINIFVNETYEEVMTKLLKPELVSRRQLTEAIADYVNARANGEEGKAERAFLLGIIDLLFPSKKKGEL